MLELRNLLCAGAGDYRVISREDIERIHRASLGVLRDMGCRIENGRARSVLRGPGVRIEESTGVVRFDPARIEAAIEKRRRPPRKPESPPAVAPAISGLTTRIYDVEADAVRPATRRDLERACIIGEALEEVVSVWPLFVPQDVPAASCGLHAAQVLLTRTRKCGGFGFITFGAETLGPMREMMTIAAGSWEGARERFDPAYYPFITSPLVFTSEPLETAFAAMERGYRIEFGQTMTISSAAAPATFAGTLVVANAETLAGLMLADATGQDWSYGASPVVLDPQTGMTAYAGPDRAVMALASLDLGRFYGSPPSAHLMHGDAVTPDFQAGFEKGCALLLQVVGGQAPRLACGLTGPGGSCGCLEQILLDIECLRSAGMLLRPLEVSDETLCVELIRKVGIGGTFLEEEHTAESVRNSFWIPRLMRRVSPESYNREKRTALKNAAETVRGMLNREPPRPLTPAQEEEIAGVVAGFERRAAA